MNIETKYLAQVAEWDHIDYDDALPPAELAASLAPDMARDAKRYRMIIRLAAEDDANYTDEDGPLTAAANEIAADLDEEFPDTKAGDQMARMLDRLVERFPEAV